MSHVQNLVSRFHQDRRGSNSLEQIVIFALGVMVLGGVWWAWKKMPTGGGGSGGIEGFISAGIKMLTGWDFGGAE